MDENLKLCVDLDAAKALVRWKYLFADEVAAGARRIAMESGEQGITLSHYKRAAQSAIHSLSAIILDGEPSGDGREAA